MNIVSFALAVPFEGIPHAGGEYYLRHVQALREHGHVVLVVAPESSENLAAVERVPPGLRAHVVRHRHLPVRDRVDAVRARVNPIASPVGFIEAVRRDPVVAAALQDADLVEFQWTHMVAVHPHIRSLIPPGATVVGFAHDVVSQGFARRAEGGGSVSARSLLARVRKRQARRMEPRLLHPMTAVLTFSDKDRDLLRDLGVRTRIEVVRPPMATVRDDELPASRGERTVLFVGAFNRLENTEGALWLLREVWPQVLAAHPDARLEIVGAHAGPALREVAAHLPSVEVTGYVDDLGDHYRRATLAVVPLLLGAGVKFKTVVAMAWGLPIVTTEVGLEGVVDGADPTELGVTIGNDAVAFAAGIVAVLDDPDAVAERAQRGRRHAIAVFGLEGFAEGLDVLYADVRSSSPRSPRTAND